MRHQLLSKFGSDEERPSHLAIRGIQIPGSVRAALYLLFLVLYTPSLIVQFIPVGVSVSAAISLLLVSLVLQRTASDSTLIWVLCALSWILVGSLGSGFASTELRYLVFYPSAGILGYLLFVNGYLTSSVKYFLRVSVLMAVLAIVELSLRRSLIGDDARFEFFARMRTFRASVASDHPLVLGVFLVVAIASIGLFELSRAKRVMLVLVLLGGIIATDGRFPLIVGCLIGLGLVVKPDWLMSAFSTRKVWLITGSVIGWLTVAYLATYEWTNVAYGSTAAGSSAAYRPAIYSFIPDMLKSDPFGIGFEEVPRGVWLVQGESVVYDLGNTVDSELVLLVARFGYLGLLAFGIVWTVFLCLPRPFAPLGLMGLAVMVCGISLAITAWNTLGTLLFILLGMAAGVLLASRRTMVRA